MPYQQAVIIWHATLLAILWRFNIHSIAVKFSYSSSFFFLFPKYKKKTESRKGRTAERKKKKKSRCLRKKCFGIQRKGHKRQNDTKGRKAEVEESRRGQGSFRHHSLNPTPILRKPIDNMMMHPLQETQSSCILRIGLVDKVEIPAGRLHVPGVVAYPKGPLVLDARCQTRRCQTRDVVLPCAWQLQTAVHDHPITR